MIFGLLPAPLDLREDSAFCEFIMEATKDQFSRCIARLTAGQYYKPHYPLITPQDHMHLIVAGGDQPSRGMRGEVMPAGVNAKVAKYPPMGRYVRWKGSPVTPKS